ncbi:MAG: OmpA family protein [Alphaproteobacteria bacterium]|nr:OmpA family protein [Alphaproteobacteria bacterium]
MALSAVFALGFLLSGTAQAGVLRTAGGAPALTKGGAPVFTSGNGFVTTSAKPRALFDDKVVFFGFNRSVLTQAAKSQLRHLAATLGKNKTVTIVGYADRMGHAEYNERLALRRAKAVRDFLVGNGVRAKTIEVRSLGKSVSRTNCPTNLSRDEAIACLSNDRRVEIEVE